MQIPFDKKWLPFEHEDYMHYLFLIPVFEIFTTGNTGFGFDNARWQAAEFKDTACMLFMTYDDYKDTAKSFLESIFTNPDLWDKVNQEAIDWADQVMVEAKELQQIDPKKLSDEELIAMIKKWLEPIMATHVRRGPMWFIEQKENLFSNYLHEYLRERAEDLKSEINPIEAFQVLTTPTEKSYIKKQQEDLLRIAQIADEKKRAQELETHIKAFEWMEYGMQGNIMKREAFEKQLAEMMMEGDPVALAEKAAQEIPEIKCRQQEMIDGLQIHGQHSRLFKIARESIYVKVYSKDSQFFSYYCAEPILKEIAKRGGLSLEQLRFLTIGEYSLMLLHGHDYSDVANQRMKHSLVFIDRGRSMIYQGQEVDGIFQKLEFVQEEEGNLGDVEELKGQSACPGKVSGRVKIINTTQEMMKMHQGDILVSHMTNPDIVPAMKQARAIVTDQGGITCHAAIVSRELGTPCVIGTKVATKVLKDGDKIEVDADKGIVKILK